MLSYVEFRSSAFPPYPGESDEINPGRYGKRLAQFLSAELKARGEHVGEFFAEDWGWCIPIEGAGFNLWIGVGNYEEYSDGFLCFIEPHTDYVWKLWKKIPTRARLDELQSRMAEVLAEHPEISEVKWQTHGEFHRGVA